MMTNFQLLKHPAQHSVHPPSAGSGRAGGSLRVFKLFAWLEVNSAEMAWSRPAHQQVTQAVRRPDTQSHNCKGDLNNDYLSKLWSEKHQ